MVIHYQLAPDCEHPAGCGRFSFRFFLTTLPRGDTARGKVDQSTPASERMHHTTPAPLGIADAVALDDVRIRLHAEPGTVRHAEVSIHCVDEVAVKTRLQIHVQALEQCPLR